MKYWTILCISFVSVLPVYASAQGVSSSTPVAIVSPANNSYFDTNTVTFVGTTTPSTVVTGQISQLWSAAASTTSDGMGNWSLTFMLPIATSTLSFTAQQAPLGAGYASITVTVTAVPGHTPPTLATTTNKGLSGPRDVAVQGNYAYVVNGNNNTLEVFNVATTATPVKLSSVSKGLSNPRWVDFKNQYAFVVSQNNNALTVIDTTNPKALKEVATTTSGLSQPMGVAISGNYAYVASRGNSSLVVFDISDPLHPTEVGSFADPAHGAPFRVAVSGTYAYVSDNSTNGGLYIIDVSTPSAPVEATYVSFGGYTAATDVYLYHQYAYVTAEESNGGLYIVDISNPKAATLVSKAYDPGAVGVTVQGSDVYVTSEVYNNRLEAIDVSNLASPLVVWQVNYPTKSAPVGLFSNGTTLFLTRRDDNELMLYSF